jgi:hypothetical protein
MDVTVHGSHDHVPSSLTGHNLKTLPRQPMIATKAR